jgi:hypothetical protein
METWLAFSLWGNRSAYMYCREDVWQNMRAHSLWGYKPYPFWAHRPLYKIKVTRK